MKASERFFWQVMVFFTMALFVAVLQPAVIEAGVDDMLLGVRYMDQSKNDALGLSELPIDMSQVNAGNFSTYFTASTLTISGSSGDLQIGAIWTATCDSNTDPSGCWRSIRIAIDTDGTPGLEPYDWGDAGNPWNMTTGTWAYPAGYPGTTYDNGNNDGTIDFDGGETFPWDNFEWWWYESQYDFTQQWWMENGQLMLAWWSGRDSQWNVLPNGTYNVNGAVDEDDNMAFGGTEANSTVAVTIETAFITGTVQDASTNPIQGARVEAGSHMAWGETRTAADGTFTVSGLEAGANYHVRAQADGKVTGETNVEIAANAPSADTGIITLSDAVAITGTVQLPAAFTPFENQWGWTQNELSVWVDAWNMQGPGWGNAEVRFQDGEQSAAFTINISPPANSTTYNVNFHAEGYASEPVEVSVDTNGGNAGTVNLTKASIVTGTVQLPVTITEWRHIDVQAINTTDSSIRYWGWGNVDPNDPNIPVQQQGQQGTFRLDGVPAGTFTLQVRVMGFAMASTEITVVQDVDLNAGTIAVTEGSKITGTLTIQGDTTTVQRWMGDNEDPMFIWVDAWSYSAGWGGTNVSIARGLNQNTSYSIGGLSDGTFEIHAWIGEGYELQDENGNSPVTVALSGNTTVNLVLRPYEGVVTGTITGDGVTVDMNKVVVEVKRPWDWLPPRIATVANGGINGATGVYTVSGLGTADYVVKAGMYDGYWDNSNQYVAGITNYDGQGRLKANTDAGVVMARVFVQNSASSPSTQNITFEQGYSVSGTVSLSTVDPPWHDVDGNGKKDTDADPSLSEVISFGLDVAGRPVMAMPMEMMFMGGQDPRMGFIQGDGSYTIPGLAPGVYQLMPPSNSQRIEQMGAGSTGTCSDPAQTTEQDCLNAGADWFFGDAFEGGERDHHWTTTPQVVVVADADVTGVDFTFGNGYTITGRLTLPEAQSTTEGWEDWMWVGHLEMETPDHSFMGHGKPLHKKDFNDGATYDFIFHHVANGDYLIRFWTDRYVPGGAKVTVNGANVSTNLTIEKGANLVGKLVDADTGEAVTSADDIRVWCEAVPWTEGSWRETRDDDWSNSYIESDAGLQTGNFGGTQGQRENKTPGKFHLNSLPTGKKYIVVVESTSYGQKTQGAKNYVGQVIAGIDIPEGATGDIDVGTIELKEGTTIKGRLTDADGNGIPGIMVFAMPSDTHDGTAEAEGTSDTQGYYTVYGVNPNVEYYDLIAAERPDIFEHWGKKVEWGEKRKYNVPPGTTDADFILTPASSTLSGTITIPAGVDFTSPFKGEGESFPASIIILQRKGVVYKDMLDGIESMTTPAPSGTTTTTYGIDNIAPGTYKMLVMNYGLPTQVIDEVVIADGSNTQDVTWTSIGYTISGGVVLPTGGYPSTADISGVVSMNTSDQSLTFGMLTQEADGTYSAYEVPGLADGETYQLVFYKETGMDDMPDVFPVGSPFTVAGADITDNTATITRNVEPLLMLQAVQDPDNDNNINLGIFSTAYLVDQSISVVLAEPTDSSTGGELYIETGGGSLSAPVLSGDKRNITTTYTKDAADGDVSLVLAVHYGDDATTKLATLTFNANAEATNGSVVNVYMASQVKLGNGDASQIYLPAGSLDTSDKVDVTITESTEGPGALSLGTRASAVRASQMGVFSRSVSRALPSGVTAVGNQYDFTASSVQGGSVTFSSGATATVQIEYDPNLVNDVDDLNVWHLIGSTWTKETTSRTVDTENNTISVEVTSLSPFVAGEGERAAGGAVAASSGGGCFIDALTIGRTDKDLNINVAQQVGMVLLALLVAAFLVLRSESNGQKDPTNL